VWGIGLQGGAEVADRGMRLTWVEDPGLVPVWILPSAFHTCSGISFSPFTASHLALLISGHTLLSPCSQPSMAP
jgi:hypothetical protein